MRKPSISAAEWDVLQVVWSRHPIAASEVVDLLPEGVNRHPRTVKTLLNRLLRKGVLVHREDGKRYLYSPAVRREDCVREESRSFLRRVFGGEAGPALVHFVEEADLSREEIERLEAVLDRLKRKKGRRR